MEELNNSCPLCKGGEKKIGTTTCTVELGFGVVVVRKVPALICDQCGSDWIDDSIAEKLEGIVESARKKHPVVEVANWDEQLLIAS